MGSEDQLTVAGAHSDMSAPACRVGAALKHAPLLVDRLRHFPERIAAAFQSFWTAEFLMDPSHGRSTSISAELQ
jgi:hypothetical protein